MPDTPAQTTQQPDLTTEAILAAGLNDLLDQDPDADYGSMFLLLVNAAAAAEAAGEVAKARALGFMTGIASMTLTPTEKATPFRAYVARSFVPENLTGAQIDLLAHLVGEVKNPLLRARLADLVWLKDRRKGITFPRMAIDAYRMHPVDAETWDLSGQAVWHRALQLAVSIGAGAETRAADIEATLLGAFDRALGSGTLEPMFYVRPLYAERRGTGEASRIASEFERIGRERLAAGRSSDAEGFFDGAANWYERARMPDKRAEMLVMIGASLAAQAEALTWPIARHEFITRSIKAYRDVGGPCRVIYGVEEIIDQLRAQLAVAGRLALGKMHVVRGPSVDLTDSMQQAVRRVQGKTPLNALLGFCTLHSFPNRVELYEEAGEYVADNLVECVYGDVTLAEDGRAIARRDGAGSGTAAEAAQVAARATKACCQLTAMIAHSMIRPALDAMQLESHMTPQDFVQLAGNAGLVPRDRVDVMAKGLYAGYCGDYVQAIHILVPQFEHMVRVALQDAGAHTSTHDGAGLDMETGLSTLVERPQMVAVFGDDLTFTIRSIMCEQEGPNLRNAVAHGMADSGLCESMHGVYAWWLILRLVVESYVADRREEQTQAAAAAVAPEQTQGQ